jgi:hypothetical protein
MRGSGALSLFRASLFTALAIFCLLLPAGAPALGAGSEMASPGPAAGRKGWKKRWVASWLVLAAVNSLDVASSQGRSEANPLFRSGSGRFSTGRALLFKSAIGSGFFAAQFLIARKQPQKNFYKPFAAANGLAAAGLTGVVLHNYSLPRPDARP